MARKKDYVIRPSVMPFLMSMSENIPWVFFWVSSLIHEVHPPSEEVPMDREIWYLAISLETNKWESSIIEEEGATTSDDTGV